MKTEVGVNVQKGRLQWYANFQLLRLKTKDKVRVTK